MRIELPSGTAAELTVPDGTLRRGIVLVPDLMSIRPLFDDMAARLAAEHGWAICAFDIFPGEEALPAEERLPLLPELDVGARLRDAVAAAGVLAGEVGVEPVGLIGFCTGGAIALRAGPTGRFDRIVAFYGMVRGVGPALPVLDLSTPVLELVGGRDAFVPPDDADWLERQGATVVRYPEADHAFVQDPARDTHRLDDAADAWRRAVDFLRIAPS